MQGTLQPQRFLRQVYLQKAAAASASRSLAIKQKRIIIGEAVCVFCQHKAKSTVNKSPMRGSSLTRRLASSAILPSSSRAGGRYIQDGNGNQASELIANPPDITNYYTIFPNSIPCGPPPGSPFEIPLAALRREYLKLQTLLHPDKYPVGPAKQRAEALSARINEAYRTLADPLRRSQYLLAKWHGIDVTVEDGTTKHPLDHETLMTVMEVQETIAEAALGEDAEATVDRLKEENAARVDLSVKTLTEAFDQGDIETARQESVKLRFWYTVGDSLKEWEPGSTEIRVIH